MKTKPGRVRLVVVLSIASWVAQSAQAAEMDDAAGLRAPIPVYKESEKDFGFRVCLQIQKDLQETSSAWAAGAWVSGIVGALSVVAASFIGTGDGDDPWYRTAAGPMLSVFGGSAAAFSAYSYSRSDGASLAAMDATRAMTESGPNADKKAYDRCADAKAGWIGSRIGAGQKSADTLNPVGVGSASRTGNGRPADRRPKEEPAPPNTGGTE